MKKPPMKKGGIAKAKSQMIGGKAKALYGVTPKKPEPDMPLMAKKGGKLSAARKKQMAGMPI